MLASALNRNADSVFLDILTAQDLEMLKARKQKGNLNVSQTFDKTRVGNKRYMILTYVVEFDKVHYPLPLNFEENPDVDSLKATIKRMRMEIEDLKLRSSTNKMEGTLRDGSPSGKFGIDSAEFQRIKVENDLLKDKCRRLEEAANSNLRKSAAPGELDHLVKSKIEAESELEKVKKDYVRDVRTLTIKLEETASELEECRNEIIRLKANSIENKENISANKRANQRNEDQEAELLAVKKQNARNQHTIEQLTQEITSLKTQDQKQKNRIRQLEQELESALKRATFSRGVNVDRHNSPYVNRSRDASPSNASSKRSSSMPSPGLKPGDRKRTTPRNAGGPPSRGSDSSTKPTRKKIGFSPLRSSGYGPNDSREYSSNKRDTNTTFGYRKPSPKARNFSPANRSPAMKSSGGKGLTKSSLNTKDTSNKKLSSKTLGQKRTTYVTDSEDELTSSKLRESNPSKQSFGSKNSNQRSKENLNPLKESKVQLNSTPKTDKYKESKLFGAPGNNQTPVNNELDSSVDVRDIDERLSKLQDLLKLAKA